MTGQEVIDRIEELEGQESPLLSSEHQEWADLRNIADDLGAELEGVELIAESDFQDHARALAEEVGQAELSQWPATCIDWERAAEELRHDYTIYEIEGETFYARA